MSQTAVCILSVAPMRAEPSDRSEMVSQILFGESCEIIDTNEKWAQIKSHHDNYVGWMDKKQLDFDISASSKVVNASPALLKDQYQQVHRLGPGCLFPNSDLEFHLGSSQFSIVKQAPIPNDFLAFAKQFLGTPYLWGGRSIYGIDCSGYTQLIARYRGHSLPRDAYQQAELGSDIGFIDEAETGDLAFFENPEGKIIHVGMIVRDGNFCQILHASGHVRCDTLDHEGIFRHDTKTYTHKLRIIKRH